MILGFDLIHQMFSSYLFVYLCLGCHSWLRLAVRACLDGDQPELPGQPAFVFGRLAGINQLIAPHQIYTILNLTCPSGITIVSPFVLTLIVPYRLMSSTDATILSYMYRPIQSKNLNL